MPYVINMGYLVKLSTSQWEKYLAAKLKDHNAIPEEYGTPLEVVMNVTDWTCGDAEAELAALHRRKAEIKEEKSRKK